MVAELSEPNDEVDRRLFQVRCDLQTRVLPSVQNKYIFQDFNFSVFYIEYNMGAIYYCILVNFLNSILTFIIG